MRARGEGEQARSALAELYRLYFYPVVSLFAARRGFEAGQELAQEYFVERVLPGKELVKLDLDETPSFRSWLFRRARAFIGRRRRYDCAKKRDVRLNVSLEQTSSEGRPLLAPGPCSEEWCRRGDSVEMLRDVLARLREQYCSSTRWDRQTALRSFEALKPFVRGTEMSDAECKRVARELEIEPDAAKKRLERLRGQFIDLVRGPALAEHGFEDVLEALNALREPPVSPSSPGAGVRG